MKAKYFIGARRNLDGCHVMHKEGCPFLTDANKAVILGMFHSPQKARNIEKLLFNKTEVCRFCCKEYYDHKRKGDLSKIPEKEKSYLYNEITTTWDSALKSFLN